jgi:hypothetical protein
MVKNRQLCAYGIKNQEICVGPGQFGPQPVDGGLPGRMEPLLQSTI